MYFYTSITTNYLPKARVLAKTLKQYNQDAIFYLAIADDLPQNFDLKNEPFDEVLFIQDIINVDNLAAWIFKHTVVELCTAIKAAAALKIFNTTTANKVVYLDPDIAVFSSLDELSQLLDNCNFALTPHLTTPEKTHDAILDNEVCALKHGIYNLGFLAVRRCDEGMAFLKWWHARLLEFCYDDIPNGIFTDQRWIDLAPAFFDGCKIIREPNYNIATWNLNNRLVSQGADDEYLAEGKPLQFFHFSGFDSKAHHSMLSKYGKKDSCVFKLSEWYTAAIAQSGQENLGNTPCKYSFYSNGEKIENIHRKLYRTRKDLEIAFPSPYSTEQKNSYLSWLQENLNKEIMCEELSPEVVRISKILQRIANKFLPRGSKRREYFRKYFKN